jgi:hypothetical protein
MKTLRQLIDHYGSDKNLNEYTPIYHSIFNSIKDNDINLLEIGIGTMIPQFLLVWLDMDHPTTNQELL